MAKRLLILGAGPTGLGAAYRLEQLGYRDYVVCERNPYVGGLSASFRDAEGFIWDIGGHVVFSHYPAFDAFFEEMTRGEVFRHERKSYIRIAGRWVPYPFQNNIRYLPPDLLDECLRGVEEAARGSGSPDTSNFLAWNVSRFGPGIVRCFIRPDNEKRWACPLETLSTGWVGDRVSPVDYERIRENVRLGRDDISWGPNRTFQFPRRGGTGAVFEAMRPRIEGRLRLAREAVSIDPRERIVGFSDGSQERYDSLLSTMPLDHLAARTAGIPGRLADLAAKLRHADGFIVGFGFRRPVPSDKCWIYCPDPSVPFFRTTYFSNYSPFNAPDKEHYSLMCDVSYSDLMPRRRDTIAEEAFQGLVSTGIVRPEDRDAIVSTYVIDSPYTYPVPTLERDRILEEVHAWFEPLGIHSRGRFGTWLYEIGNMDHSVVMGMQWADAMLTGGREGVWLDRK